MTERAVIRFPAKVTFADAPALLARLAPALGAGARDLDLAGCEEFDSSLIGVLLELGRRAVAAGGPGCRVLNPPPNLRKLAKLYGVDGILLDERN